MIKSIIEGFFTWFFMALFIQLALFSWWWGINDFTTALSMLLATFWMFITYSDDEMSSSNESNGRFGMDARKFTGSGRRDAQKFFKFFGIGKSSKK